MSDVLFWALVGVPIVGVFGVLIAGGAMAQRDDRWRERYREQRRGWR